MRVLITGGLGVNGAWVARRLVDEGHEVTVADVRPDLSLVPDLQDRVEVASVDVRDLAALQRVLQAGRIERVAHLAAIVPAGADPYLGFSVNAQGTVNVLEAARTSGVRRVVFTSSRAAYAPFTGEHGSPAYRPVPEEHPREPLPSMRVYSVCKILAEEAGKQFADSFGLEFVALRFATIYGPGKKARHGPIGVYSRIIENAMLGVPTVIEQGGEEADDLVYVRDVAQGIVRALTVDRLGHWVYNIGGGGVSTLHDFAAAVRQVLGDVRIEIGGGRDPLGLGPIYGRLDISRAAADLGYAPEYDLARGVADYMESLRRLDLQPTAQESESSWSTGSALPGAGPSST